MSVTKLFRDKKWRLSLSKVFVIVVFVYLIVAIPLFLVNESVVKKCYPVCEKVGFNLVYAVRWIGVEEVECNCYDTNKRERFNVLLEGEKK